MNNEKFILTDSLLKEIILQSDAELKDFFDQFKKLQQVFSYVLCKTNDNYLYNQKYLIQQADEFEKIVFKIKKKYNEFVNFLQLFFSKKINIDIEILLKENKISMNNTFYLEKNKEIMFCDEIKFNDFNISEKNNIYSFGSKFEICFNKKISELNEDDFIKIKTLLNENGKE